MSPAPTPFSFDARLLQPGNVLVHADGRFLLADFDVSKDTLGAHTVALTGGVMEGGVGTVSGDGSSSVPGDGGFRAPAEAETTRTSLAGTHGFMAPEVGGIRGTVYTSFFLLLSKSLFLLLFLLDVKRLPTVPCHNLVLIMVTDCLVYASEDEKKRKNFGAHACSECGLR